MTDSDSPLASRALGVAVLTMLPFAGAPADDAKSPDFSLSAFGTVGVVHSDYEQADFVSSVYFHRKGVGYTRQWGVDQDTKLGVQLDAEFTDRFSAVVQAVSQLRYDSTFRPTLEWANVRYEITPELSIRAGRVLLPTFLTSDIQNVGYVNRWVRTPAELLVQLPLLNSDGVDLSYQFNVGAASNRLQLLYGSNKAHVTGGITYENTDILALADTIDYGPLTVHLGYQRMRYVYATDDVQSKIPVEVFEVAAIYDTGGWYVTGERFDARDDLLGNTTAWYLGGGYRIGDFTPYAFHATIEQTKIGDLGLQPTFDQKTTGAGLRWDFMKNFAAKLQYERITLNSLVIPTSFTNLQPNARMGDHANIFSATVDFVW